MPSKNYASTRFSALTEITPQNVATSPPQFTFSLAVNKGQEAAPIVADNTMYIVTAYPNYVYALDLTKPGAPMKWKFAPKPLPASQGVACCDVVNRGGTVDHGKYIFNTLDGQIDRARRQDRQARLAHAAGQYQHRRDHHHGAAGGRRQVYVGNSGGEMGVRGWIAALDENTGKLLWKAYNTGPDKDVLIGSDFKPFYACRPGQGSRRQDAGRRRPGRSAAATSGAGSPMTRSSTRSTTAPATRGRGMRSSDRATTSGPTGIFARDPATGAARWYYQYSPHDEHDYDGINEQLLLDMPFGGKMHKVLIHIDRNGYVYVIDRSRARCCRPIRTDRSTRSRASI